MNPNIIAEAFPECAPIVKANIKELNRQAGEIKAELVRINSTAEYTDTDKMFLTEMYNTFLIDDIRKKKSKLKRVLAIMEPSKSKNKITQRHIEKAKDVRIRDVYEFQGRKVFICPFHDEKTPSFHVYANNTFHCFGCGANGDTISFIQRLHNTDFIHAVKFLNGM